MDTVDTVKSLKFERLEFCSFAVLDISLSLKFMQVCISEQINGLKFCDDFKFMWRYFALKVGKLFYSKEEKLTGYTGIQI